MVEYKKHPKFNIICCSNGEIVGRKITSLTTKGYKQISINGKKYAVHRIVYEAFHECELDKNDMIDHIDKNKTNNDISNLRIVNNMENQYNTIKNRNFIGNCNGKTYICNAISYFSRKFNLSNSLVTKALNGKVNHVKGWMFIDIDLNNEYSYLKKQFIDENKKDIIILKDISELVNIENNNKARFEKVILATNLLSNEKYIFSNLSYFCKTFNLNYSNAQNVLSGKRKKHKNFKFELSNEYNNLKIQKEEIIKL